MQVYLDTLRDVLLTGNVKTDRTGTGTISKFGGMMKFSLTDNKWPIVTTRKVNYNNIASELEWFIKGMISVQWMKDHKNPVWNAWAGDESGTIGPMYGEQWRNWNASIGKVLSKEDEAELETILHEACWSDNDEGPGLTPTIVMNVIKNFMKEKAKPYEQGGRSGTDQLQYIIDELKNNPDSRRMCLSLWHAGLLPDLSMSPKENADAGRMALAPCHSMWQVETSLLTDMEILKQIHPSFVELHEEGMVNMNNGFGGSSPTISEKGYKTIEQYKAEGKPTRKLSLLCYARSQDLPLGNCFNVGMYTLLAHILAKMTNMVAWEYTHMMGDYHIYSNQVDMVKEQLTRKPMKSPTVIVPHLDNISDFDHTKLEVTYESHPAITFPKAAV